MLVGLSFLMEQSVTTAITTTESETETEPVNIPKVDHTPKFEALATRLLELVEKVGSLPAHMTDGDVFPDAFSEIEEVINHMEKFVRMAGYGNGVCKHCGDFVTGKYNLCMGCWEAKKDEETEG